MKRLIIPSLVGLLFLLSACGPGLILGAGGTVGVILGLDNGDDGGGSTTPPPPTTNVTPAVVVTSVTREESPCSINYTIIDANLDLCDVEVEYDAGSGFGTCTAGAGGDGLTGLASSAGGTAHVFSWDYLTDEGPGANANVSVRIRADDGQGFGSWFTLGSQSIGNDAPTITNVITTGSGNVVLVTFDFSDVNSDVGFVSTAYSINQGANFIDIAPAEFVGNPPSSIASSPSGSPGQFIWNSLAALPDYVGEVLLRLVPADMPSGFTGVTLGAPLVVGPASVDNSVNGPPEVGFVTVLDAATFTGEVEVDFDLLDEESDASLLAVEYSEDGTNWFAATLLQQIAAGTVGPFFTSPSPSLYSFTWDALADAGDSAAHTVKLRIAGHDGQTGNVVESDWFTIIGNEAPQVSAIDVFQNSGNITLNFSIWDENFDPVSLSIQYSINGGTLFSSVPSGDWIFGDPANVDSSPVGEGNILIWDTVSTLGINNYAGVILRATPTDTPSSAPSAGLSGAAFDSAPFPVVNDAAGADPISIEINTTAANSTTLDTVNRMTVPLAGSIGLAATVNPASATVKNTYWVISDTGANYGSMSANTGSAGTITQAQGSFDISAFGSIVDGDTFTIDDGIQGPQTFEFDSNSAVAAGNTQLIISFWTTNDQAAVGIAAAINNQSLVAISAVATTNTINLTHFIGCRVGNTGAIPGNATDIAFSNATPFANINQMGTTTAGISDEYVTYTAPAVAPVGSDHVTIFCAIDHPNFQFTVTQIYEIYFGDAPTAVSMAPASIDVLIGEQQQFTSAVLPASAPQAVWWEVDGGAINGTINQTGFYSAPSVLPAINTVNIRAYSIDDTVIGIAVVNLIPEPTSIVVTSTTINLIEIDVGNQTEQFGSQVNPTAAPQTVTWRIFWDGNNMGSGNLTTVGTVSAAGLYTSPNTQPIPDVIFVEAVSTVRPAVFGSYQLKLKALVPTSFTLTPSTVTLTAGGAGQQFTADTFLPVGANGAVIWSISPAIGSVSASGFYTPPTSLAASTIVNLRATSAVAPLVFEESAITVNPPSASPPTSITLFPTAGMTFSNGDRIQFTHTVNPGGASQSVTWSVVSGGGTIDASGKYTPVATTIDDTATIRCETTVNPAIFEVATIIIDGNGNTDRSRPHEVMGKADHAGLLYYDVSGPTQQIWYVGGVSPVSGTEFSTEVRVHEVSSDSWHVSTELGNGTIAGAITSVSACIDDFGIIWAVVAFGNTSPSEVWSYDTAANGFTGNWVQENTVGPTLTNQTRYTIVAYPSAGPGAGSQLTPTYLLLIKDNKKFLPFRLGSKAWLAEESQKNGPKKPSSLKILGSAYEKDATDPRIWFAGQKDETTTDTNGVWRLDFTDKGANPPELTWKRHSTTGQPTDGLRYPALAWDANVGQIIFYGGYSPLTLTYRQEFWNVVVDTGAKTSAWTKNVPSFLDTSPSGPELAYPQARAFASITLNIQEDKVYLYGGQNGQGEFGDVWSFDYPTNFVPDQQQVTSILPAGRESPAAAIDSSGTTWVYGGLCSFGPSDELWALKSYDPVNGTGDWELQHGEAPTLGEKPPPLWGASFEYDSNNNVFYLLGGATDTAMTNYNADVYKYDPSAEEWIKFSPSGGPGALAGMATHYSTVNDAIAVFGGSNAAGTNKTNGFYSLDVSGAAPAWNTMTSTGSRPGNREYATLGYNSVKDFIYLIGGDDGAGGQRQLFVWDSGNWTQLSVLDGGSAEDVSRSGGAWDEANLRFFNAPSNKKNYQSVTLTTNGPSWHYLIAPSTNNTTGSVGVFDPNLGYYICMFGRKLVKGSNAGTNIVRSFMVK